MTLWEMLIMKKPYHCSLTHQILDKDQVLGRYVEQKFPNVERWVEVSVSLLTSVVKGYKLHITFHVDSASLNFLNRELTQ